MDMKRKRSEDELETPAKRYWAAKKEAVRQKKEDQKREREKREEQERCERQKERQELRELLARSQTERREKREETRQRWELEDFASEAELRRDAQTEMEREERVSLVWDDRDESDLQDRLKRTIQAKEEGRKKEDGGISVSDTEEENSEWEDFLHECAL
jgi:hypothetical protein